MDTFFWVSQTLQNNSFYYQIVIHWVQYHLESLEEMLRDKNPERKKSLEWVRTSDLVPKRFFFHSELGTML